MTYAEKLAAMPRTSPLEYVTNKDYRRQKSALTRAVNSGDPRKVLAAVEKTLAQWQGKAWPDDWNRWRIALEDAEWTAKRSGDYELANELYAAGVILFRF